MEDSEELRKSGTDEAVEVNQRALIDKVLARYSGEFTLFRELLQNSDDARSNAAEIRFETAAYRREQKDDNHSIPTLPDLNSIHATKWTFRNDGEAFTEQDWRRLPRIAEGNPRPEKIGAFGVGFYSLFSVTESPFVSSGGRGMQFYWKDEDKLYIRRGEFPLRTTPDPWTTFEMPLREAGPIPQALDFMRFLASSITFMVNLREVGVFVDEHCIGRITKLPGTIETIKIPEELKCSSPNGMMKIEGIQRNSIKIEAEVMHAVYTTKTWKSPQDVPESHDKGRFFSSSQPPPQFKAQISDSSQDPVDPARPHRVSVDLTIFTAEVKVELEEKLKAELCRSTKKQPPPQLKYGLIYTGKDEYDRSLAEQDHPLHVSNSIFQGLRADLKGATHTRIFIGHATGQTTGIGGHMASYFIPTVERESIDLKNISVWNEELLYVGGFLSRAVYELELEKIRFAWEGAPGYDSTPEFRPGIELQDSLDQRFLHILKFFTFHHSTPSAKVSRLLEAAFYECSNAPLRLLSSAGVRQAPEIKECDLVFAKFLKYLPMLPQVIVQECRRLIKALPERHKISPITFSDVLQDLRKHLLTPEELVSCLQWWTSLKDVSAQSGNTPQLLSTITLSNANGTELRLSSVEFFIGSESNKARIPLDGPLPASLIPNDITRRFTAGDLVSFGWKEFTIVDWLRHISRPEIISSDAKHDFTRSIAWAERVLNVLAGVWSSSSEALYREVKSIFNDKRCIPTSHGLRSPEESFLSSPTNASLFRALDLPIVRFSTGPETKEMEAFLSSIGVQRHVPAQLLLARMVKTGNWSISDLINYLVQVQNNLNPDEFSKLKAFEAFTREGALGAWGERMRHRAQDLYPPLDIFRQLQLPVIDWGGKSRWRNDSEQAELLYRLGLCRYPPLEKIIELCGSASPDERVRENAFKYLCDNLRSKYSHYNPANFRDVAFIPAETKNGPCLAKLGEVFLGISWRALGFSVVHDSRRKAPVTELGIQQHPPTSELLRLLEINPPSTEETARQWFESLFECIPSFSQRELTKLSELPIIPTRSSSGYCQMAPNQCYLGEGAKDEFHAKLFVFVDFGTTANRFLKACGSKNEPSVKDIAESLVEDPEHFFELAGGADSFLAELRDLASRSRRIPNLTLSKMMSKPILLGMRRTKGGEKEYERTLREPGKIVIADDMNSYRLFEDTIFVVPEEPEGLEGFYASLGCRRLSTIVQEKYKVLNVKQDPKTSTNIQKLVLERLPLFLREVTHAPVQDLVSRFSNSENFTVKVCEQLLVYKTLTVGDKNTTRQQDAWAATKCDDEGHVELWLSGNSEPDMYEIAASLCRLLFGTAKVSDTLLLTTILSTPLDILKRRGYNVDGIPEHDEQQSDERTEDRSDGRYMVPANLPDRGTNDMSGRSIVTTEQSTVVASLDDGGSHVVLSDPVTPSGDISQVTSLQRPADHATKNARHQAQSIARRLFERARPSMNPRGASPPQHSWNLNPRVVMPQSYIRAQVTKAINVCNSERGNLLHHRNKVDEIKDFPNAGYCDISGQIGNMKYCKKNPKGVKFYTAEDVTDPDILVASVNDKLDRFVDILIPIANLFGLSPTLLHVFYTMGAGPIGFNREGSIFLNLRYFEAWHDQDTHKDNRRQAQISWFFALAHELAHNLIKQHNSEHEFWFSAICEAYVPTLSQLLGSG